MSNTEIIKARTLIVVPDISYPLPPVSITHKPLHIYMTLYTLLLTHNVLLITFSILKEDVFILCVNFACTLHVCSAGSAKKGHQTPEVQI